MNGDSSFQGCCPAHDPCPRHVSAVETAAAAPCAMRVEGTNGNSLEDILEHRSISRRDLVRFAGLTATASAFSVGSAASAVPQQIAAGGAPVFDPHKVGTVHTLSSNNDTVRVGTMDPAAPVVLTIRSGDVVSYPNTWVNWGNEAKEGMSFAEREPIRKRYPQGPYSLIGPVAVEGAEPGDVIECRMLRLRPISWGWNSAPKGVGALPGDFEEPYLHYLHFDAGRKFTDFGAGVRIPLAPIQGVMAAQPAGDKPVSAILSGHYGGNIVLRELVEGTALFLPVEVSGGRLWTGDSHAAQGDGCGRSDRHRNRDGGSSDPVCTSQGHRSCGTHCGDTFPLDCHGLWSKHRRRPDGVASTDHRLAEPRDLSVETGRVCAQQHRRKLSHNAIRASDKYGLHIGPGENGARNAAETDLQRGPAAPDRNKCSARLVMRVGA